MANSVLSKSRREADRTRGVRARQAVTNTRDAAEANRPLSLLAIGDELAVAVVASLLALRNGRDGVEELGPAIQRGPNAGASGPPGRRIGSCGEEMSNSEDTALADLPVSEEALEVPSLPLQP